MTALSWTEQEAARSLAADLTSVAALCAHQPDVSGAVRAVVLAELDDAGRAMVGRIASDINRQRLEAMRAGMTVEELHARAVHPGYEYASTEGPRKRWDHSDVPPEGDGWVRNTHVGDHGWERFEYTEESYWMRPIRAPREIGTVSRS